MKAAESLPIIEDEDNDSDDDDDEVNENSIH